MRLAPVELVGADRPGVAGSRWPRPSRPAPGSAASWSSSQATSSAPVRSTAMPASSAYAGEQRVAARDQLGLERARPGRRSRCAGSRCWPWTSPRRRRRRASTTATRSAVRGELARDRACPRRRRRRPPTSYGPASDRGAHATPASDGRRRHRKRPAARRPRRPRPAARRRRQARQRGTASARVRGRVGAQPGRGGDAERGGVRRGEHLDRGLQQVGLGLHEQRATG